MVGMFSRATLSISRASKQYVYDESGTQYLDCVNGTAHVGHCHPQVNHNILHIVRRLPSHGNKTQQIYKV